MKDHMKDRMKDGMRRRMTVVRCVFGRNLVL